MKQKPHITAIRQYMNELSTFFDMRNVSILVNQNVTDHTKQKPHITAIRRYMNELSTFIVMRIVSILVNQNEGKFKEKYKFQNVSPKLTGTGK